MSKNEKDKNNLHGFEEAMDLVHSNNSKKSELEKRRKDKYDPHELYNFLELENLRLQKLDIFFNDKVQNLVEHPTTEELCDIQQNQIAQTKKQLWSMLHSPKSIYLKNLRMMFNNVFS